ncbi:hypothetical protein MNBD_GAMMA04-1833, partial [hydrothermal vent metagenome]
AVHSKGALNNRSDKAKKWRFSQMQNSQSGQVIPDPTNSKNAVMQFIWQKEGGKNYDANTQKKAHLYGEFGKSNTQEEVWSFRVYFPSKGMEKDNKAEIIIQWHGHPDTFESDRHPPLALDNRNDQLTVTWLYDQRAWTFPGSSDRHSRHKSLGKTPKDQWVQFVFHIKWDPDGDGMLKVWQDGRLKIDQHPIPIGFNDRIGPYLGFGIYKFENNSQHKKRIILFDDIQQWIIQ